MIISTNTKLYDSNIISTASQNKVFHSRHTLSFIFSQEVVGPIIWRTKSMTQCYVYLHDEHLEVWILTGSAVCINF